MARIDSCTLRLIVGAAADYCCAKMASSTVLCLVLRTKKRPHKNLTSRERACRLKLSAAERIVLRLRKEQGNFEKKNVCPYYNFVFFCAASFCRSSRGCRIGRRLLARFERRRSRRGDETMSSRWPLGARTSEKYIRSSSTSTRWWTQFQTFTDVLRASTSYSITSDRSRQTNIRASWSWWNRLELHIHWRAVCSRSRPSTKRWNYAKNLRYIRGFKRAEQAQPYIHRDSVPVVQP